MTKGNKIAYSQEENTQYCFELEDLESGEILDRRIFYMPAKYGYANKCRHYFGVSPCRVYHGKAKRLIKSIVDSFLRDRRYTVKKIWRCGKWKRNKNAFHDNYNHYYNIYGFMSNRTFVVKLQTNTASNFVHEDLYLKGDAQEHLQYACPIGV